MPEERGSSLEMQEAQQKRATDVTEQQPVKQEQIQGDTPSLLSVVYI